MRTCAHPLAWKPAHAFRRRLAHFNNITSRQTEAQYIDQSQPKADWPRRARPEKFTITTHEAPVGFPAHLVEISELQTVPIAGLSKVTPPCWRGLHISGIGQKHMSLKKLLAGGTGFPQQTLQQTGGVQRSCHFWRLQNGKLR